MKKADIYLGNINSYNHGYLLMCPLYKINDEYYAVLEWMEGIADYFQLLTFTWGMSEVPHFVLSASLKEGHIIYVDANSLSNFYREDEFDQNVTVAQAKNDWVSDPRVPIGCDVTDKGMVIHKRMKMPKNK